MKEARILVVEDEAILAMDIKARLLSLGYPEPEIAGTGAEGIRKAEQVRPDLVLMDIMLPGELDGIQAAAEIHSRLGIPVVFLTAYSDEATVQRAKLTEPYGYMIKPFQDRELEITVEIALYRHDVERKLKEAQECLRLSEERYRELVELSPDAITVSSEGRVVFVNGAGIRMFGVKSADELIGRPVLEFVHPDYREIVRKRLKQVTADGKKAPLAEEKLLRVDGSAIFVDTVSMPYIYEGKPAMVSIVRNITERKQLEDELNQYRGRLEETVAKRTTELARMNAQLEEEVDKLRRAEEALALRASILDNARDVVFLLNPEGNFAYVNKAALNTYGYSESEFLKMKLSQLLPPQDAHVIGPRLKKVMEEGQLDAEAVHHKKDGTPMKVQVRHSLLKTLHGQFIVSNIRVTG